MTTLTIATDGAVPNNQNESDRRAGIAVVAELDGEVVYEASDFLGEGPDVTNKTAEYEALMHGLKWLKQFRPSRKPSESGVTATSTSISSEPRATSPP